MSCTVTTVVSDGNNPQKMPASRKQVHAHGHVLNGGVVNVGDAVNVDYVNATDTEILPMLMRILNKSLGSLGMMVSVSGFRFVANIWA